MVDEDIEAARAAGFVPIYESEGSINRFVKKSAREDSMDAEQYQGIVERLDRIIAGLQAIHKQGATKKPADSEWDACPSCGGRKRVSFEVCYTCKQAQEQGPAEEDLPF